MITPIVACIALLLSSESYRVALQALSTSQQTLKIGQRAYLHINQVDYQRDERAAAGTSDGTILISMTNYGNTPAYLNLYALRIVAVGTEHALQLVPRAKTDYLGYLRAHSKRVRVLSEAMQIAGKDKALLKVGCSQEWFRADLPSDIHVAALLYYRDIFDDVHVLSWGWQMKDLRVTRAVRDLFVATILSSQGISAPFPKGETIREIDSP